MDTARYGSYNNMELLRYNNNIIRLVNLSDVIFFFSKSLKEYFPLTAGRSDDAE